MAGLLAPNLTASVLAGRLEIARVCFVVKLVLLVPVLLSRAGKSHGHIQPDNCSHEDPSGPARLASTSPKLQTCEHGHDIEIRLKILTTDAEIHSHCNLNV